jgi:1-acyl-sn-glycerol-3-phosphate acyltransferase
VQPFYLAVGGVSWPILHWLYRLETRGVEHLPPAGGLVLASNHSSSFDAWALGMPLWPRRQLRFMAKSELFNPALKPFMNAAGAFPVRRGERDIEAIETAVRLCREGEIVTMFPEGTRQTKGLRKKFEHRPRTGAARIALGARVPLVPAAVRGTAALSRLEQIKVAFGEPVPIEDLYEAEPHAGAQEATDRLMASIEQLKSEL